MPTAEGEDRGRRGGGGGGEGEERGRREGGEGEEGEERGEERGGEGEERGRRGGRGYIATIVCERIICEGSA